jgi:hypothetical protein
MSDSDFCMGGKIRGPVLLVESTEGVPELRLHSYQPPEFLATIELASPDRSAAPRREETQDREGRTEPQSTTRPRRGTAGDGELGEGRPGGA